MLVLCTMIFTVSTGKLISSWLQYKQASDDFNKKLEQESPDFSQERNALFLFCISYLVYWFLMYCSTTSLLIFPRVLM